ncbi:MAG: GDYXXLXY domain-containing protein [Flavobacteriales bacterium]
MNNKILLLIVFVLLCSAQLYFPAKVVFDHQRVLDQGTLWKFNCVPIDPNDPFRGKYITLRFADDSFTSQDTIKYERDETVYASLQKDSLGYAKVSKIQRTAPSSGDYLTTTVSYTSKNSRREKDSMTTTVNLNFPFDRFYMEESKAKPAESAYRDVSRQVRKGENASVYAMVKLLEGAAVLEDVMVNDIPIKKYVEQELQESADEPSSD